MKTLTLSLHKAAFDVMVTGEKIREFRKPTKWILSRLYNKDGSEKKYDAVKFINGYGAHRPYFVCKLRCFYRSITKYNSTFSNGLNVEVEKGDLIIVLGDIIETGNL